MSSGRPGSTAREWLWTLAVVALLGAVFALTQPFVTTELSHDGNYYVLMAEQIQQGQPPHTINPFVLRAATPWLAAAVAGATGLSLVNAFFAVNVLAATLAAVLFAFWLRPHVPDLATRLVLLVFFLVAPHSPFRFTFYYPTLTDSGASLFLTLGLIVLDRLAARVTIGWVLALTTIVAVGCAFRELVLVLAVAALFVPPWRNGPSQWALRLIPFAGIASIAAIRSWVVVTPSQYSMAEAVQRWLEWKTLPMLAVGVLFVFGPLLALVLYRWRATLRDAIDRPDLVVFTGAFAAASWLGASDTERILVFAAPVLLMLIGKTLAGVRLARAHQAFAILVVIQLLGYRVWLPIGDLRSPFFFEHFSFFSVWLDQLTLLMFLAAYGIAALLAIAITRSIPLRAQAEPLR